MSHRVSLVCVGILAFLGVLGLTASPLPAATITVNTKADDIDPDDRKCSLREAIIAANTNVGAEPGGGECLKGDSGGDLIVFEDPPGSPDVYALSIPPSATNDAHTGDLNVTEDLIITGNGGLSFFQTETIVDGGGLDRVLRIGPGISVQIERITIRNGAIIDNGAGIYNEGTLLVRESSILSNRAECSFPACAVSGAGLWNRGSLTIEDSVVGANLALCTTASCDTFGGGIFNDGSLSLDSSAILYNDARCTGEGCFAEGGGIYNGSVTLVKSGVLLRNRVQCDGERSLECGALGGGVYNAQGFVDMNAVVVQNNRAECRSSLFEQTSCMAEGGGLSNNLGNMPISGTSVVGNSVTSTCPLPPCGTGGGGLPHGGGIHNRGNLHLSGSQVSSNLAGCGKGECHARGGGLFNDPFFESDVAVVIDSTLTANAVVSPFSAHGGGIDNLGPLEVERSTFALNFAFVDTSKLHFSSSPQVVGGGIASPGDARIVNATLSGNFVACWGPLCPGLNGGGGLYVPASGSADVAFTTFVGNSAFSAGSQGPGQAGILSQGDSTLRIKEAIVAVSAPRNCAHLLGGTLTALGANLATDSTCLGFSMPGTNPQLGPLAPNGGPTATHALLAGSPAIDAASDCQGIDGSTVQVDQRNTSRPKGPGCDLGAYERFRLLGGGGVPNPFGLGRDTRATSDRVMCRMLRTLDRGLRAHERLGALAPEDADAIREVAQGLFADVECPGARHPRLDESEDRE